MHFDSSWLTPQEQIQVDTLRTLSLPMQTQPFLLHKNPNKLDTIAYFKPNLASCLERCKQMTVYAYGDVAICLGLPALSLTGMLLHTMSDDAQAKTFLKQLRRKPYRSFFAVTEPGKGTDAMRLESHCEQIGKRCKLNTRKWYVGKAATADCGVVMVHDKNHGGLQAIYLTPEHMNAYCGSKHLKRHTIPMGTLQAAHMGCIAADDLPIAPWQRIGHTLPAAQRSAYMLRTFNLMRPTVGAMAFGLSRAILDHLEHFYPELYYHRLLPWQDLRQLWQHRHTHLLSIATAIDHEPDKLNLGSMAKLMGIRTAHEISQQLLASKSELIIRDKWLRKWIQESCAFEFMEGISAVHYRNVCQGHIRQSFIQGQRT